MPIQFVTKLLKEVENESVNFSPEELEEVKGEIKNLREQIDRLEAFLLVQELEKNEDAEEKEAEKSRDVFGIKRKKKAKNQRDFYGRVIKKPWLNKN